MKINFVFGLIGLLSLFGCSSYPELKTVDYVDLKKYAGKWYEISAFPQSFQKGCNCTSAEYILTESGDVKVINSCRIDSVNGELKVATGKAVVKDEKTNAKLSVSFFWPFSGKYWIIELADDYSYAVVGHPNREYLWILGRKPEMDETTYNMLLERIKAKGFDISKLKMTEQKC